MFVALFTLALGSYQGQKVKGPYNNLYLPNEYLARGKSSEYDHGLTKKGRDAWLAREVMEVMEERDAMQMLDDHRLMPKGRGMSKNARTGETCVNDGQCYNGDNPSRDCCNGRVTNSAGDIVSCTELNQCNMCTQIASNLVKTVAASGSCALVGVAAICGPILGTGVGAPLAAACAFAVPTICSTTLKLIARYADPEDHVEEIANDVCNEVGFCSGGGGTGSINLGQACGCVPSGYVFSTGSCASDVSHCCSGKKKPFYQQAPCPPGLIKCTD